MRRWLRVGGLAAISCAVGWVLYRYLKDFDPAVFLRFGPGDLSFFLAIRAAGLALNVVSTRALLGALGHRAPVGKLFLVLNASSAGNYTTPFKLGVPLRIFLYSRVLAVGGAAGSLAVAVESYAALLVTGAFSLLAVTQFFPHLFGLVGTLVAGLGVAAIGAVLAAGRLGHPRGTATDGPPLRLGRLWSLAALAGGMKPGGTLIFLGTLTLDVVLSGALLQAVLRALGAPVDLLTLVSFQALSFVVGLASMLPMGLGAKEASLVYLLAQVGVAADASVAAAAAVRLLTTGLTLVLGLASANALGLRKK